MKANNFTLLTPANTKKTVFELGIRVGGYNDTMHYMAHLVKVCIMALEGQDSFSSNLIPEPNVNISSVLELLLNMIPYEETEFLDKLHTQYLQDQENPLDLLNLWLIPPPELLHTSH